MALYTEPSISAVQKVVSNKQAHPERRHQQMIVLDRCNDRRFLESRLGLRESIHGATVFLAGLLGFSPFFHAGFRHLGRGRLFFRER